MNPTVAVVMPTYNQSAYIARSVTSVLEQTYRDLVLVIADNASTDATLAVLAPFLDDPRVRLVKNERNVGVERNFAICFDHVPADIDVIFMLPSDDLMTPKHVETMVGFVKQFPDAAVVHADASIIDSTDAIVRTGYIRDPRLHVGRSNDLRYLVEKNYVLHPGAALVRPNLRIAIDELFLPEFKLSHDWNAWMRLMFSDHAFVYTGETTVSFRVHEAQVTRPGRFGDNQSEALRSLESMLAQFPQHADVIRHGIRRQAASVAVNRLFSLQPGRSLQAASTAVRNGAGSFLSKDLAAAVRFSRSYQALQRLRRPRSTR